MTRKRINPESGVIERENHVLGFIPTWEPEPNDDGNNQRVNPDTGVLEEQDHILGFIPQWNPVD